MSAAERSVLLVSGAPASGKSTVAAELAKRLGWPLLAKDPVKESLYDALGDGLSATCPPEALSHRLSRAAVELLWTMARGCPQVILEANFRPHDARERACLTALGGRKLEMRCRCSAEEAMRRFARRAAQWRHHPAHSLKQMTPEMLREYDEPFGLCPVIDVNTEEPVDADALVAAIRQEWQDLR